mmetsp:Transcript_60077/g.194836  ORF Transcript_60077/g.194836 Transcript_60077/m.194836 type:complete len:307 (+) Transcript_60077:64-984(+)
MRFSILLLVCAGAAHAATMSETIEIRNWVVDYQRPTNEPRKQPFDLGDNAKMGATLANNAYPAPSIEAFVGDDIEITIVNQMLAQEVDFVFEGSKSADSGHMLPMYTMTASKPGTFWWHARLPTQAATGLKGALVVRAHDDPAASLYQEERILALSDAMQVPEVCLSPSGVSDLGCPEIDKATLNGQWGDGSNAYPMPVVEVQQGRCYRLRWLGMMSQPSHFQIDIQDHTVKVLGGGSAPASASTSEFGVASGAGVDTVLCADQHPIINKDYSIKMTYVGKSMTKSFSAKLRYSSGSASEKPNFHV